MNFLKNLIILRLIVDLYGLQDSRSLKAYKAIKLGIKSSRATLRWLIVVFLPWGVTFENKISIRRQPSILAILHHIIVIYNESFIFHWFPSNRGYHSNNTSILLLLNKADFLEI